MSRKSVLSVKKDLRDNWLYYGLVSFLLIIGITSGVVVADGLKIQVKLQINSYLLSALNQIGLEDMDNFKILINSFLQNMFFFAIIIALSFMRIGFIFVLLLDFLKGLFIGFTLFFLNDTFRFLPLLGLSFCILPSFIILTSCFLKVSELGTKKSICILFRNSKNILVQNDDDVKKEYFRKIVRIFVFMFFGVLLETYYVPMMIKIF